MVVQQSQIFVLQVKNFTLVTSKGVVCAYSASGAELLITIQRESEGTEALASCH